MKSFVLLLVFLLTACDGKVEVRTSDNETMGSISAADVVQTFNQFEQVRVNHVTVSLITLDKLQRSITEFLNAPDPNRQRDMQRQWLAAHKAFLGATLFSLEDQTRLAFQVDAWPIQEGFLDSIPTYPYSGIINDLTVSIDADSLQSQHGITDSQEVSLGFHALEYFIFNRRAEDFDLSNDELKVRRRQALQVIFDLLIRDIDRSFADIRATNLDFLGELESVDHGDLEGLRLVIRTLHARVKLLFSEVNYLSDGDFGHSRFSRSSWINLRDQVAVLYELSGRRTELRRTFEKLDEKTAHDYDLTLNETAEILSYGKPSVEKFARVPLLFMALGHQLDDLQIILKHKAHN